MAVDYRGKNSERGPSMEVWHDCDVLELIRDPNKGVYFFDDFLNFSQHITDQDTQTYSSYIDTGVTIKGNASAGTNNQDRGVVEIAGNDADNDEGSITTGGNTGTLGMISDTAGSDQKLWFEARIKKASIADNALAFFVGLSAEGLAGANTLVDNTGEIADNDFIGFRTKHDNGEELDFVHNKNSGSITETIAAATSMVADTWIKVGFKYEPAEVSARRISIYLDGVKQSTYVTGTTIATANFPDGEELALLLATKVGAAAESKFYIDWWRFAQLTTQE